MEQEEGRPRRTLHQRVRRIIAWGRLWTGRARRLADGRWLLGEALPNPRPTSTMAALPMFVPPILGMIGSAWFMVAAHQARADGRCRLDLPWSAETSAKIVQDFHLAAWVDIERLARLSSECIAQLHTDVVASYLVVWALTCVPSIVLMIPVTPVVDCSDSVGRKLCWRGILVAGFGAILFLSVTYLLLSYSDTINFGRRTRLRYTVSFDHGYVNTFLFWMYFQTKGVVFSIGLWFATVGLKVLWHCRRGGYGTRERAKRQKSE